MGKTHVMRRGHSVLADLKDGGKPYPVDYPGRVYCVNNITGSSGNDGSNWPSAFDEVSTAITASEAYRATFKSTNQFIRNTIYVQGTATAYSRLTALPSYCDIIGIGANPRGNGAGIARIITAEDEDAVESAGVRGLYMENMQLGADLANGKAGYAMDLAIAYRSTFVNCTFLNMTTGGVRVVKGGSLIFRNCQLGGGDTANGAYGLNNSGSENFNNVEIEKCFIFGETDGVQIEATACNNTWIHDNFIYGKVVGIDDNSDATSQRQFAYYTDNRIYTEGDGITTDQGSGKKSIGNQVNDNGTTVWDDAIA